MKTTFDILSAVKRILDPMVADEISGKVLLRQSEKENNKTNVILGTLSNSADYVQSGVMNINPECLGVSDDIPNMAELKRLIDIIIPLVDEKQYFIDGVTLHLSIENDKGIFKDSDKSGMFFYNLRVNFLTL